MNTYLPKIIGFLINLIGFLSSSYAGKLAITVFSLPKKGGVKENESKYLDTATQEAVRFGDISIMTYRWIGSKETILLVHGWESNAFRWKRLIRTLQSLDYDVIALDAPAHGKSGGKLFTGLLYSECIHTVAKHFEAHVVIGHSMGGMSAVIGQQKYRLTSIRKLVLLGSPSNFVGLFGRYILMMGYNESVVNGMNRYCLKHYNHLPEYFSAANVFKDIQAKGLIIHDKDDQIIPYNDALEIKAHYKNSELITTTGFGHRLKSKKVDHYIVAFLNE